MNVFNDLFEDIQSNRRFAGIMVGIVTNIEDPDNLGRVKVRLLNRSTPDHETDFIRVMTPMAGSNWGMFFLPEVGDEVLVAFGDGDISRPYVLGSLWNKNNTQPAKVEEGGKNNTRIIKSKEGHTISFSDDTEKDPGIKIQTKQGLILNLLDKDGGKTMSLSDGSGNMIEIKSDDGKGTFETKTEITIKSDQGTIKLGSSGIEIKGGNIKIEGQQVSIKGTSMKIEGSSDVTVNSSGVTNVKGSMVKVN